MTSPVAENFSGATPFRGTQPRTALFAVGSDVQLDSVRRIAAHLRRPIAVADLWRSRICRVEDMTLPGHLPPVTPRRIAAVGSLVRTWARVTSGGVLVVPQDVGLVCRRAIAAARRGGAPVVLLPDGAVSRQKVTGRGLLAGVVPVVDAMLCATGFMAGRHGRMAASRPDLVLSWGPAWDEVFRSHGVTNIADVGNPRSDDLVCLPAVSPDAVRRILICSQPMDHEQIGGKVAQTRWFEFLERMTSTASPGELAIRLHPTEREHLAELPLGPGSRAVLTQDTTLADDIGASDAVVSWASTTMIEAAAAGRAVVSVAVNDAAADMARGYFFQRDSRAITMLTDEIAGFAALAGVTEKARTQQAGMAADYAVNVGTAALTAAAALDAFG